MGYKDVPIPKDKDPKEYNHVERRAEMLRMMLAAGHPDNITQVTLASRYGVSQAQISHDKKALMEEFNKQLGEDATFITEIIYRRVTQELMRGDNKDKYLATKVVKDWNDWLYMMGAQQRTRDKIDTMVNIQQNINIDYREKFEERVENIKKALQEQNLAIDVDATEGIVGMPSSYRKNKGEDEDDEEEEKESEHVDI